MQSEGKIMNIYALLSLCASGICIALGVSVYFLNQKSTLNRLFMLTMVTNAYCAFCEFMLRQSTSLEAAQLWSNLLFVYAFFVAFALHFTLAYTESNLLKNKLAYVGLYLPPTIFAILDLTTNWISETPTLKFWGYTQTPSSYTVLSNICGVWAAIIGLTIIMVYYSYYIRSSDKTKRTQTKFIAAGFAIPVFISIITDSIFPVMGINFPPLGNISSSLTAFIVAYAVVKYELFCVSAEIAAENIFSTMPDAVILTNLKGLIVKVNRSLIELTGYKENEVVGQSIKQMVEKAGVLDKEDSTPKILAQLLKQRELRNIEISFYTKTGEKRTGTVSCSVVSNNSGTDVGLAFVLHDITKRKAMEQKLLKSERLASIGELAGIIGHDLRNPLTGIRAASYYLKTKYAGILDSKDEAMFDSIDKSIEYSNKIIHDLIDYSSEIKLELENTTPKKLVKGALALIKTPENIKVIDETSLTPDFQVDANKMRRSFLNIIKNAFDAMPNGGKLTIKGKKVGKSVIFNFKDNGEGMSKETLSKLWTPLFTTKAKGMGFGLAICKRTVKAHGGKMTLKSSAKKGTEVTIAIPYDLDNKVQWMTMLQSEIDSPHN